MTLDDLRHVLINAGLADTDALDRTAPVLPGPATEIAAVTEDSRRAGPGSLFVAVRGEHVDGHTFITEAVVRGAVAIVGSHPEASEALHVPFFCVSEPRKATGIIAQALAGNPSRAMTVIAITGTNGKSSTAFMVQAVLQHAGHPTANFGTMGCEIAGKVYPAKHTTLFGEELAGMFARARAAGQSHLVMEASSHALEQGRVAGIDFDAGVFTNLSQDHLDYHRDMAHYRRAKLLLFEQVQGAGRFTVVNADDPSAQYFIEASRVPCHTFGRGGEWRAEAIRTAMTSTRFTLSAPCGSTEVELCLPGRHNVSNALCAAAVCGGLGLPLHTIAAGLKRLEKVPGRFETIDEGQDFHVIVDYAHTDDGLRNVLEASRELCAGRVITVFGCGGDRDRAKRPKMGAVAARLSDFVLLTSDNPRTEDPCRILSEVEAGLEAEGKRRGDGYRVIEHREEAIREAIGMARPGDLIMIAGKGHEDYQILGATRIHFDDREVVRAVLKGR